MFRLSLAVRAPPLSILCAAWSEHDEPAPRRVHREVERRIEFAAQEQNDFDPSIKKPSGIPAGFMEHGKLLFDLQSLAFQADLTRVMTFMIGREGSVRTYGEIGVPDPHHPLSHHNNRAEAVAKCAQINTYHMELFAYFIGKLQQTVEGDGTLLDHSMILYGSGISDSNRHTHNQLPVVVAGNGGGALQTGRHVGFEGDPPITNLFMTMLHHSGVRVDAVGDSTGILEV